MAAASSFCGGGGEKKIFLVLSRRMHVVVVVRNTVECGESEFPSCFSLSLFLPCLLLLSVLIPSRLPSSAESRVGWWDVVVRLFPHSSPEREKKRDRKKWPFPLSLSLLL